MAEPDSTHTIRIAGGPPKVVTGRQLDALLADDPKGLIEIVSRGGTADAAYQSPGGDIAGERLDATQLRNRKEVGQTNILFGAKDPKRELIRKDEQRRAVKKMTQERQYQALVGMRNFVPGIQFAENYAVGTEEATRARQQLISEWGVTHMGTQLGAFVAGGLALKTLAKGTALGDAVFAHRSSILGKTGQLIAEDALAETMFFTNHLLNNNLDFSAEDLASQVGAGLIFVSPMVGSYAARNVIGKGLQYAIERAPTAGRSVSSALTRSADIGVGLGLLQGAGDLQRKLMQRSAGVRVLSRLFRKNRSGRRVTKLDLIEESVVRNIDELDEVRKMTPEWFVGRKTTTLRQEGVQRLRDLSGEAFEQLDEINFPRMTKDLRKVGTSIEGTRTTIRNLNAQIKHPANIGLEDIDEGFYTYHAQAEFDRVANAGYGDIANHLENNLNLGNAKEAFGGWVQARVDAKINKAPGFEPAEAAIRRMIENEDVWGKTISGRGKIINEGIDQIAKANDELEVLSQKLTDRFDAVDFNDVKALEAVDGHIDEIRSGYAKLEAQGVLTRQQVRRLENRLGKLQEELVNGKKAGFDAAQINKARARAEEATLERGKALEAKLPKTPEDAAALRKEMAVEGGASLVALRELVVGRLNNLKSTRRTRNVSFGLLALKENTTQEERNALYEEVQDKINSLAGNPLALAEKIGTLVSGFELSDPEMAQAMQQKAAAMTFYLASQLPKPDTSYTGEGVPPPPSRVNAFVDKLISAYEPLSVGVAAAEGRVTPGMIDAVRNTNPSMYAEMVTIMAGELQALSPEARRRAPKATLLGVEAFVGGLNPAYTGLSLVEQQSNYAQTQAQHQAIHGTGRTMRNPGPQDPGSDYTSTQRITGY